MRCIRYEVYDPPHDSFITFYLDNGDFYCITPTLKKVTKKPCKPGTPRTMDDHIDFPERHLIVVYENWEDALSELVKEIEG